MEKLEYNLNPEEHCSNVEETAMLGIVENSSAVSESIHQETAAHLQYEIRNGDGTLYKVLQLKREDEGMLTGNNINSTNTVVNPTQCQFYVISNPTNEFVSTGHKTLSPKIPIANQKPTAVVPGNIKKRDERRRATHNEVERRRRDKINNGIMKLSKIIPDTNNELGTSGNGHFEGLSKGGILAKAFEYITELKEANTSLSECLKDNDKMNLENIKLQEINESLRRENEYLKAELEQNGITLIHEFTTS